MNVLTTEDIKNEFVRKYKNNDFRILYNGEVKEQIYGGSNIEGILYGNESENPRLPLPDEIAEIFKENISTLEATPSVTNGASNVSTSNPITITFNNAINKESVFMINSNGEQIKIEKEFDADNKVLTITPKDSLSASSVYILNLIGVSDKYNQELPLTVIKFTTSAA